MNNAHENNDYQNQLIYEQQQQMKINSQNSKKAVVQTPSGPGSVNTSMI